MRVLSLIVTRTIKMLKSTGMKKEHGASFKELPSCP